MSRPSLFRKYLLVAGTVTLGCILASCSKEPVSWHMVNVNPKGQGDAHLLVDNGVTVLIDAGELDIAKARLLPYLQQQQINSIDHFFVSHPHTDHYAGLQALLEAGIAVHHLYYNLPPAGVEDYNYKRQAFLAMVEQAKVTGTSVVDVAEGFLLKLPNSEIEVLYAHKNMRLEGKSLSVNDYSIILSWQVAGFKALFTGDLDAALGLELSRDAKYQADILKIPHHGVQPVAPNVFFDTVSPQAAMIPAPPVLWVHPRGKQVRSWVQKNLVYYCHNGRNGNVVLHFLNKTIVSESDRATESCPNGAWQIKPSA